MTQASALSILKMGHNVFLTGSAGAGKTYVLNAYIKYLREHSVDVAVTASTGIAATHMGGMTIHAWSGMGIRDVITDFDIDKMEERKYLWDRYDKVKVLIIDEISMLSGNFLDNLDRVCRSFKRNHEKPFGGIQIILCGDLFQLPPISRGEPVPLVIESNAWKTMNLAVCYLTEQHRQDDNMFLDILNAIRANTITPEHINELESRIQEYDGDYFQNVTKLFTHNADVDAINNQQLEEIADEAEIYTMTGKGRTNLLENLRKSCLAPETLRLKIGAEVMFVKNNFDRGYVNGTRGRVTGFNDEGLPIVTTKAGDVITVETETWSVEDESKVLASITQIPLRHAWAITVHKSQGMSLDSAVIDLSKSFTYGMGYVALSRVRTLDGVILLGLGEHALIVDPKVLAADQKLQQLSVRAETRLTDFSEEDLKKLHDDFVVRSGGKLEKIKIKKKELLKNIKVTKPRNHEVSYELIKAGKTLDQVAVETGYVVGTVIGHLEKARDLGLDIEFTHVKPSPEIISAVKKAFETSKQPEETIHTAKLAPAKSQLEREGLEYDFNMIKLARVFIKE